MHYTEAQKAKLEKRLLNRHIFVEGGAVIITPTGEVHAELTHYHRPDLILSIEDAADPAAPALKRYFDEYPDSRHAQATLRPFVQKLAQQHGHPGTPFQLTAKMSERIKQTAHNMAHHCTEEAELLLRAPNRSTFPPAWPVLLKDKPFSVDPDAEGLSLGMMRPAHQCIIVTHQPHPHPLFHKIPKESATLYEELAHFADNMLAQNYLRYDRMVTKHLLTAPRLKTALKAGSREEERLYEGAPKGADPKVYRDHHDAALVARLRRSLHMPTTRDPKGKFLPRMDLSAAEESDPALDYPRQLLTAILDLNLAHYKAAMAAFDKDGDGSRIAPEVVAKTYALTLACRDQLETAGKPCDLDTLVTFVATGVPKQGKAMYAYTKVRDEYLNQLRASHEEPDFPADSVHPPNRWRRRVLAPAGVKVMTDGGYVRSP